MTPILYRSDETLFTSNGLGRLDECLRCIVTEGRNGVYECEFDYPQNGRMFPEITRGRIIGCTHDDTGDIQPFDIYASSEPINGVVTFYAHHISYRLSNVILTPFEASTCAAALSAMQTHVMNPNPFTFWTDKDVSSDYSITYPVSVRAMLGGTAGSILDIYGKGEYQFDKWTVKLYTNRGSNNGVTIRYGVNMMDIVRDVDISGSYSAVAPYWRSTDGDIIVTLPEGFIVASNALTEVVPWTNQSGVEITDESSTVIDFNSTIITPIAMDLSGDFENKPTISQLRTLARKRLNNSKGWRPDENIKIDFVQLWQTEEYADVAALQMVALCDRVDIYHSGLGLTATNVEVVKVVYNVLLNRYDSMELGDPHTSFADIIEQNIADQVNEKYPTKSALDAAIEYATQLIAGNLGGYVVFNLNANGEPEELLIMDTPNTSTAVNVWRFNKNGLGHSHSGYNGPFSDIALTADGRINASMITAGVLDASLIRAGVITDGSGVNSWDIIRGILTTRQGRIGDFTIKNGTLSYGSTDAGNTGGEISRKGITFSQLYSNGATGKVTVNGQGLVFYWDDVEKTRVFMNTDGLTINNYDDSGDAKTPFQIYSNSSDGDLIFLRYLVTLSGGLRMNDSLNLYGGDYTAPVGVGCIKVNTTASTSVGGIGFSLCGPSGSRMLHVSDEETKFWTYVNMATNVKVGGSLTVVGTKSRAAQTDHYSERLLYCYETPSPLFGDIGEGVIAEDGRCYVWIDPILAETITTSKYQVFVQPYGDGKCYVSERKPGYFVVAGDPGLEFGWELKAKQRGYEQRRLDTSGQIAQITRYDYGAAAQAHINQVISEEAQA